MEEIIAGHIQDERVQSLTDHLDGTMRLAEGFGAGMGLPNIKKYTDYLDIQSTVGVGTTLTMKVFIR